MRFKSSYITILLCILPLTGGVQGSSVQPLLSNPTDYQLVFQDEFDGSALDWNVWGSDDAIKTSASGQTVGRWKDNAVLADGLLKLMVYKGNRIDSEWTAGFVWVKETFGPNTYYESRFRVTTATGVNNAFWTTVQTVTDANTRNYKNRYEIDVVEAKVLNASSSITGHLAWHDWKTYSYAGVDIAQGISKTYNTISFQTWGLWVGEDNFIIYCDGVEQWRGTTHSTYTNQWNTGVGKLPSWPTNEEKRAYGKWGQSDWRYMGGMNGDDMNIAFSTMPWSVSNSTLKDDAHGTSMDIEYMRIYKKKNDLITTPVQQIATPLSSQSIALTQPFNLNADRNYYFSFIAERPYNSNIACAFKSNNQTEISLKISKDNELILLDNDSEVSTAVAYPAASTAETYFGTGRKYLIVGRITASSTANDIVSIRSFELGKSVPVREPFLYRNIDSQGNTSVTNEWHINKKLNSNVAIDAIVLQDDALQSEFTTLTFGDTYAAVVAPFLSKPVVYLYGETKSVAEKRIYLTLEGKFPFSVTYTDGKEDFSVNNITQSPYTFTVNPSGVSQYKIVAATDGDGVPAMVGGSANFYVADANFYNLRPVFDTYLTEGTSTNPHTASDLFVTNKTGAAQESFLVFQLPEDLDTTGRANAVFYYTSKSVTSATKIELLGISSVIDATTTWNTIPAANQWEALGSAVLGGTAGFYINFDITPFCNDRLKNNQRQFTLKLKQTIGDVNAVTKFKPGHNTSSSVPSYIVVQKDISSGIDDEVLTSVPKICFHASSRQVLNCSGLIISRVMLYNTAGQLIAQSEGLPFDVSVSYSGLSIAYIVTPDRVFIQKLMI